MCGFAAIPASLFMSFLQKCCCMDRFFRHCEKIYNSKLTKQSWEEFLRLPFSLTFARNDDLVSMPQCLAGMT
ncbi:hypothetical protein APHACPA_1862, partial [Rickettsia amblyommatis str. Ac/Pa]